VWNRIIYEADGRVISSQVGDGNGKMLRRNCASVAGRGFERVRAVVQIDTV